MKDFFLLLAVLYFLEEEIAGGPYLNVSDDDMDDQCRYCYGRQDFNYTFQTNHEPDCPYLGLRELLGFNLIKE